MVRKTLLALVALALGSSISLSYGASQDGAKALFFGDTTKESMEVKQTTSGTAAFSGTEMNKESFNADSPEKPKKVAKAATKNKVAKAKIGKLATGLSYWIEVVRADGKVERATAEGRVFKSGERIRFAFKTNKEGYLYMLALGSTGRGTVLFPNPRINSGNNLVAQNADYHVPFGEKNFVIDANPGEERVYIFFSESEIPDIKDYFMGNDKNKTIEAKDTQNMYAYAEANGSKDILFEEDAMGGSVQPASYIVSNSSNPKSIIFKEIKLRHK